MSSYRLVQATVRASDTLTCYKTENVKHLLVFKEELYLCAIVQSLTQTVRLLSVSVALTVVAVAGVAGAHNPTKMVSTLLLTGGASTHIIV